MQLQLYQLTCKLPIWTQRERERGGGGLLEGMTDKGRDRIVIYFYCHWLASVTNRQRKNSTVKEKEEKLDPSSAALGWEHAHTHAHTLGVTLVRPVRPHPLPWPVTSPTEPPCLSLSLSLLHTNTHCSAIQGLAKLNHTVVPETRQQTDLERPE